MKFEKKSVVDSKIFEDIKQNITNIQKEELEKIYSYCKENNKNFFNLRECLRKLIIYDVEMPWVEKIIASISFKNDAYSLEACIARYGNKGEKIYLEQKEQAIKNLIFSKEKFLNEYRNKCLERVV